MEEVRSANKRIKTTHEKLENDYESYLGKLQVEETRLEERLKKLNKGKLKTAEQHGNPNAADKDVIEINAGGKIIAAKRSTLTQLKGTRFEALFSGRWDKKLQKDSNGRIFLDVNPLCFQAIVDYLNELAISPSEESLSSIKTNREYQRILEQQLQLFGIGTATDKFHGSNVIQNSDHSQTLCDWLAESGVEGDMNLLYRSSRDGLTGSDFHSKCDNKGQTISMIKTKTGMIVGGFADKCWTSCGKWRRSDKAFLFGLQSSGISSSTKFQLKQPRDKSAVFHHVEYGPVFGGGADFRVHGSYLNIFHHSCTYEFGSLLPSIKGNHEISEIEVFQVKLSIHSPHRRPLTKTNEGLNSSISMEEANSFAPETNEALNAKLFALKKAEEEVIDLENNYADEEHFVSSFATGESKDLVALNVSGTTMATTRATLQIIKDSVLARQFDDSLWTEQGNDCHRVKDWTPDEVHAWITNVEGIPDHVGETFKKNEITGRELLALGRKGLAMIGVERAGTVCLLLDEIKKLEQASQDVATLIEHSPYCFEKILDFLRLKRLHSLQLADEPASPRVCDYEKGRFKKVVEYYFPGESSKLLLNQKN